MRRAMSATVAELVRRAQAGDLEAFGELVTRFQDFVYGLAYHLCGSFEDAQDLAQEALVRAYQRLAEVAEPAAFPGWLRRVTISVCLNALRAMRRQAGLSLDEAVAQGLEPAGTAADPATIAAQRELHQAVLAAVRALPSAYALAITLYYLDGLSCREVGEFLELSPAAVKMRVHRARGMVRKELAAMMEEAFGEAKLPQTFPGEVRRLLELLEREYDQTCVLVNPEVLTFERYPSTGQMLAIPSGPLRYRNDHLGYLVTVHTKAIHLAEHGPFSHDHKSEEVLPLEAESPEQAKRWEANRRERYLGSLPHFLYAWVHDRAGEEGFEIAEPPGGPLLCAAEAEATEGSGGQPRYRLVVPGGRLAVRYLPADAEAALQTPDGWVHLNRLSGASGNWGIAGYWAYRNGFGLGYESIASMEAELRARWRAAGHAVEVRPVQPWPAEQPAE